MVTEIRLSTIHCTDNEQLSPDSTKIYRIIQNNRHSMSKLSVTTFYYVISIFQSYSLIFHTKVAQSEPKETVTLWWLTLESKVTDPI